MTQTSNQSTRRASADYACLLALWLALGCAAGAPQSQALPASGDTLRVTPPIVSVVNVNSYILAGMPCWPSRLERPVGAWVPSRRAVHTAESLARRELRDSLSNRSAGWDVADFRTQYFGVTNSNGRRIVGVGIHRRLLDPVRLGMPTETFDELSVLSSTPVFVCDAGSMQFISMFDEDGRPVQALKFANGVHGAPE